MFLQTTLLLTGLNLALAGGDCDPGECPFDDGPRLTLLSVPWDCKQYIMCQWGIAHYRPCGFGLNYDHNRTVCLPSYMTECKTCDLREISHDEQSDTKDDNGHANEHIKPSEPKEQIPVENNPPSDDNGHSSEDIKPSEPKINSTIENNPSASNSNSTEQIKPSEPKENSTMENNPSASNSNSSEQIKPSEPKQNSTVENNPSGSNSNSSVQIKPSVPKQNSTVENNPSASNSNSSEQIKPSEPKENSTVENNPTSANNISQKCIESSVTPVKCPENMADDRLMPHPDNCELFYYCVDFITPICRDCPANLHFNPVKKVCDHPYAAGCSKPARMLNYDLKL